MGLLNFDAAFNSDEGRLGLGLLAAGSARADGAGFGQRLMEAVGSVDQWKQAQEAKKLRDLQIQHMNLQMQQAQDQMARDKAIREGAAQFFKPGQAAVPATPAIPSISPLFDSVNPAAASAVPAAPGKPAVAPNFDQRGFGQFLASKGEWEKAIPMLAPKVEKLGQGESVFIDGQKAYENPKQQDLPTTMQEYNFAVKQGYPGTLQQFMLEQKRAGAPSVAVKVDNKMGESLAGQVGPMVKDSRVQTQGAVKMFDAADRLDRALASNQVTSGPGALQMQTVKQIIQKIGGGSDEGIRQTRQAIKSLAQMSVEARKQLQGQGQVTENEAAAVAKADAGDINDLTAGELKDLVTLTKRAAHFQAQAHTDLLRTLADKEETRGLVPFYNVQGLDPLLAHKPTLPQIGGGGWSIKPVGN